MKSKGVRIEQQALASKSLEFVAEEYLPEKIAAGNLLP
jgi:DNA topoisomerase-6 subunit A